MKHSDDPIGKIESYSTILVNFGTLPWWLFSVFTALVLSAQPRPISLPGVLELGASYKLLFLVSIFLAYIQILNRNWKSQKRSGKDVESTFGSYVYGSAIKLKRPIVFVGFLTILGIIGILIYTELKPLGFLIAFIALVMLVGFSMEEGRGWIAIIRRYDDEYRKRWLKRVRNQLHQEGVAHTAHFLNLPSTTTDEINWALNMYFDLYEFEQDLVFNEKNIEKGYDTYEMCEIRFEHVPSRLNK